MAKANSIQPFPADIDREAFGHWLSGFTDGEGCFRLGILNSKRKNGSIVIRKAEFKIALRSDDADILTLIQSFLGCGSVTFFSNSRSHIANAKPVATFGVNGSRQLLSHIIPHFDAFPLRSKKGKDYKLWREAVLLLVSISNRPSLRNFDKGACNARGGMLPKWTDADKAKFDSIKEAIKSGRAFEAPLSSIEEPLRAPSLFDFLDN